MNQWTSFSGQRRLFQGTPSQMAVYLHQNAGTPGSILVFDDRTGRQIDMDLRGNEQDILARYAEHDLTQPSGTDSNDTGSESEPRSVGRPRLGVVAREVTLLPRHWAWLAEQKGGASVTLRKLVDQARKAGSSHARQRQAQEACDQVMRTLLGNEPRYEEAARALYAGQREAFMALSEDWPADGRDYVRYLAQDAWLEPSND